MADELQARRDKKQRKRESLRQAREFLEALRDNPFATIIMEGDHITLYVKDDADGGVVSELREALRELESS